LREKRCHNIAGIVSAAAFCFRDNSNMSTTILSQTESQSIIAPYGGALVNLVAGTQQRTELIREATQLPSLQLSPRSLCDLELMAAGGFSPVARFMSQLDYLSVLERMRLVDGTLFPIPITLPVSDPKEWEGRRIALRSPSNHLVAIMDVEEAYEREFELEARQVCGTTSDEHCLVAEMRSWGNYYLSGPMTVLELPYHYDFPEYRRTPAQIRQLLASMGNPNVVAFQTRNPMHRAHEEMTKRAATERKANLLIHPVVGVTRPGDVDHFTRALTYKILVERHYDPSRTILSLLPLAMRMAGPREALWHAIIRRNFGANYFIVGRDHASPGRDSKGRPFYEPDAAAEMVSQHSGGIGVGVVPFDELVFLPDQDRYEEIGRVPAGTRTYSVSGTKIRTQYLAKGVPLPSWIFRPEAASILERAFPPKNRQGICIWFTGLPCSGKSTISEILGTLLMENGRRITMLDGDVVRTHLSRGLGFSREDRDINLRRIGFVAAEIVRHGGIVVCAVVSPFNSTRQQIRAMIGGDNFLLAYVNTPVEVCERRDVKGFYAKARAGELKHFTGVDDPYEPPTDADIVLDTVGSTPEDNARRVVECLRERGFVDSLTAGAVN
jgi:sulfate adenylyltransferase